MLVLMLDLNTPSFYVTLSSDIFSYDNLSYKLGLVERFVVLNLLIFSM